MVKKRRMSFITFVMGALLLTGIKTTTGRVNNAQVKADSPKTITLTADAMGISSYKTYTKEIDGVTFKSEEIMKGTNPKDSLQFKKGAGKIYNTTAIDGKITNIAFSQSGSINFLVSTGATANSLTGQGTKSTSSMSWDITAADHQYFLINNTGNAAYVPSIIITYEKLSTEPSVSIATDNQKLAVGEVVTLQKIVNNAEESGATFAWSSSNTDVATIVAATGVLTAVGGGTTNITVTMTYEGQTYTSEPITVTVFIPVTSVTLNKNELTLVAGGNGEQLSETVLPANATDKTGTWSSSDSSVATVSLTGFVTPIKQGSATITFTTNSGNKTATASVSVSYAPVSGVALNKENIEVNVGASEKLTATVSPSTARAEVTWTSSDSTVATVEDGVVTGVKAGNATITATSVQDPTKSATANVEVKIGPAIIFNSIFGEGGENEWTVKSGKFESYFGHAYGGKDALTLESIKLPNHPVNTEYKVTIIATSVASPGTQVTVYGVNAVGANIAGVAKSANMRYGNYSGNLKNATTDAYSHPTVIELPLSAVEKLDKLKIVFGSSPSFLLFEINVEAVIAPDTSYEDAKVFADWMMDAERDEEECGEKFIEAALMWEELSYDAQKAFQEHADFNDAHARFLNWVIANGFNSLAELDAWLVGSPTVTPTKAPLTTAVIISLFSITTLVGYYFISKKKQYS